MRYAKDALKMISDLRQESPALRLWGPALNFPQVLGGIVFYDRPLAVVVAVLCVITVMIAGQIHRKERFSRLTSLCHVLWLPLAPFMIEALLFTDLTSWYGIWLVYVSATMTICLVLDVWNVGKYIFAEDRSLL